MALNTVYIDNLSNKDMVFKDDVGSVTIKPHKRAIMSYKRFTQLILDVQGEDIYNNPLIRVTKVREIPTFANVTEFGVRGDGLTNDTFYFQKAIDYLDENGGGVLNVPAGVYNVEGLSIKAPTTFNGVGRKTCIIKHITDDVLFHFQSAGSCGINGMHIYGNGEKQTVGWSGGGTAIKATNPITDIPERHRDEASQPYKATPAEQTALEAREQIIYLEDVIIELPSFVNGIEIDNHSHIKGTFGQGAVLGNVPRDKKTNTETNTI